MTDSGLKLLSRSEHLTELELSELKLDDEGVEAVLALKGLTRLELYSEITDEHLERLRKGLPKCDIRR